MARWPYSNQRWQRLRISQLQAEPLCRYCTQQGRQPVPAAVVDHITPVREAPELAFDPSNLQSLCAPCHDGAKQAGERGTRKGVGIDGLPLDPDDPWRRYTDAIG